MKWIKKKWVILVVLFGIWLVFTVVYSWFFVTTPEGSTKAFETTKFVLLSISAFGVLFSTLLSSFNSLEATNNIQARINFDKTQNSIAYFERFDSPSLKEARDTTRAVAKEEHKLSPQDIIDKVNGDEDLERSVITMFNFFEEIYFAIEWEHVDAQILKQGFAVAYLKIHKRFESWTSKNHDESIKKHLNDLKKMWQV